MANTINVLVVSSGIKLVCLVHFQIALPADAKRKNTKVCEEVVIPPNAPLPPKGETPILISSLDEVSIFQEIFFLKTVSQVIDLGCQLEFVDFFFSFNTSILTPQF